MVRVALHEAMGFSAAGVWRQCGYKLGQWWEVGVWQKELQAANPPAAVTPFPRLPPVSWQSLLSIRADSPGAAWGRHRDGAHMIKKGVPTDGGHAFLRGSQVGY